MTKRSAVLAVLVSLALPAGAGARPAHHATHHKHAAHHATRHHALARKTDIPGEATVTIPATGEPTPADGWEPMTPEAIAEADALRGIQEAAEAEELALGLG